MIAYSHLMKSLKLVSILGVLIVVAGCGPSDDRLRTACKDSLPNATQERLAECFEKSRLERDKGAAGLMNRLVGR